MIRAEAGGRHQPVHDQAPGIGQLHTQPLTRFQGVDRGVFDETTKAGAQLSAGRQLVGGPATVEPDGVGG
ncbi:hypothetical protein GCM10025778_09640 [Paeniglutamicibacter antarcticus]|uniref:Uncharacterized protein n=1 Tax=Paeniglutamicibacter antarcticus TaxID=494023 RepID=A0ABP9TL19_9MICC